MLVSLLYFISTSCNFVFPLLSVLLLDTFGGNVTKAGLVCSISFLVSAAIQPLVGRRIDGGHARKMLAGAVVLVTVGVIGLLTSVHDAVLVSLAATAFLTGTSITSTCTGLALEGLPEAHKRTRAASILALLMNLAQGVAAILAFFFLSRYRSILLAADLLTTLALAFALRSFLGLPVSSREKASSRKSAWPFTTAESRALIGIFLIYLVLIAHLSATPFLFSSLGLPVKEFSTIMFAAGCVVVVLSSTLLARFDLRRNACKAWILCGLLLGIGHALMPLARDYLGVSLFTSIWAAGEAISYPLIAHALYDQISAEHKGRAASLKTALLRAALVVAPLMGAAICQIGPWCFSVVYGCLPILATLLMVWPEERRLSLSVQEQI